MHFTDKFKGLTRPQEQTVIMEEKELYGALYDDDWGTRVKPVFGQNDGQLFEVEARVLLDKLKEIASDQGRVKAKLEEIHSRYFDYNTITKNHYDLRDVLEKIYFQIKAIKKENPKADFDGVIKNLEFDCLDGTVGKLLDLKDFIETDPKKLLFNAKFEYIKQLALEDANRSQGFGAMHVHEVFKRLNSVKDTFKTELEKADHYVEVDKKNFPLFKTWYLRNFKMEKQQKEF